MKTKFFLPALMFATLFTSKKPLCASEFSPKETKSTSLQLECVLTQSDVSAPQKLLEQAVSNGNLVLMRSLLKDLENIDITKLLIEKSGKILFEDREIQRNFLSAMVQMKREERGDLLLDFIAFLKHKSFYKAVEEGDTETVKKLIRSQNVNVNKADINGSTPLFMAAQNGHLEVLKLLIEQEASIDQIDTDRWTPLLVAVANGHLEVVKLLIEKGASIHQIRTDGWTPLLLAAQNGHLEVAKLLIEKEASIDQIDTEGWTPLLVAVENGHLEVAKLLIEKGASIIHQIDGWTPLLVALQNGYLQNGYLEVAKLLIKKGVRPKHSADEEQLVNKLIECLNRNNDLTLLLAFCEDQLYSDDRKREIEESLRKLPLFVAVFKKYKTVIKHLIKIEDVNQVTSDGRTALFIAAENGDTDIVECLLTSKKIDMNKAVSKDKRSPLFIATYHGHLDVVRCLLNKQGINIDQKTTKGETPLMVALENGYLEIAKLLIEKGARPKHCADEAQLVDKAIELLQHNDDRALILAFFQDSRSGSTNIKSIKGSPLLISIAKDYKTVVRVLMGKPDINVNQVTSLERLLHLTANVHQARNDGIMPLHIALSRGYKGILEALFPNSENVDLFPNGADVDLFSPIENWPLIDLKKADNNGATPLMIIQNNGDVSIIDSLIQSLVIKKNKEREDGKNPDGLADLPITNSEEVIFTQVTAPADRSESIGASLIEIRSNVNQSDSDGYSPLGESAYFGNSERLRDLIVRGANVNQQGVYGVTPLHIATERGNIEIIRILLENRANINQLDFHGKSPLYLAVENSYIDIVRYLITNCADVNQADCSGMTPLNIAVAIRHKEIMELLISHGANVNQPVIYGITPLYAAVQIGDIDSVVYLLENSAQVNQPDFLRQTPLHFAIAIENREIINILLANSANVNQQSVYGVTPLHVATAIRNGDIVRDLFEYGADSNKSDDKGMNSLLHALASGYFEIASILIKKGAKSEHSNYQRNPMIKAIDQLEMR